MEPFSDSLEHLLEELRRVELTLRLHVERARSPKPSRAVEQGPSADSGAAGDAPSASPGADAIAARLSRAVRDTAERTRESLAAGVPLRLAAMARAFDLARFDVDALLLALLPELRPRIGDLFGILHEDDARRLPSVGLVLSLLCDSFEMRLAGRARFTDEAPLVRRGLVHLAAETPHLPLLGRQIRVDDRIVQHLLGADDIDVRLRASVRLVIPERRLEDLVLPAGLEERLCRFLDAADPSEPDPVLCLQGPRGAGKRAIAEAICRRADKALLAVDCAALAAVPDDQVLSLIALVERESLLADAAIDWTDADVLAESDRPILRTALLRTLESHPTLMFLSGSAARDPRAIPRERRSLLIELPRPSADEQRRLWTSALASGPGLSPEVDLEVLTGTFRLTAGQIFDAAAAAANEARGRDPAGGPISPDEIKAACRACSSPRLTAMARKVTSRASWEDLVVPADRRMVLEEICHHVEHRARVMGTWGFDRKLTSGKGISALFSGAPGTGKTLAAGVISRRLGLDLYQVDLSSIVSKYIGETEKHLGKLFDEAEGTSAVLFFDEADALFGKRTEVKDAHDRNANIATSYLLQRIESYDGLVILASNFTQNMDDAFVRRFRFIIDFPVPDEQERLAIWQRVFPAGMPRGPDLDVRLLAERFELAGAVIRNIAVRAAFLAAAEDAPLGMNHVLGAARREYQKMRKVVDVAMFAPPSAPR